MCHTVAIHLSAELRRHLSACLAAGLLFLPGLAAGQEHFPLRPSWISLSLGSEDVAVGDVDRDGDLDLVSTSKGSDRDARSTALLFLNDGRRLQRFPSWQSQLGFLATAVVLGDVDRDDNIDVVFGGTDGLVLFRGDGAEFGKGSAWSLPGTSVEDLALADVDGDGDLDLLVAYTNAPSDLHLNTGGVFADVPAWTAPPNLGTTCLALGDVDGDADFDLVLAGFPRKVLFLNVGGDFGTAPAWELVDLRQTRDVALGDLDGNGSLDLVAAHSNSPSAWYRNTGGAFDPTPAWQTASIEAFTGVALGDVELDSDLDLVFASAVNGCWLFLNDAGAVRTSPDWQADSVAPASSVALADLNNDGALDLVCANAEAPHFAYEATQVLFAGTPVEHPGVVALDFALGDVDTDGDADVVVIETDRTALYRIDSGVPTPDPVWTGPSAAHVTLGDVDDDGDLDLVCANDSLPNTLWLFDRPSGSFGAAPVWQAERAEGSVSVALGDANSDGRLDLLCGNQLASSHIWINDAGQFGGKPLWVSDPKLERPTAAFSDVNRDGWPDVVLGSATGTHLFLNDRNRIEAQPSWSLLFPEDTTDIALGDMDGDGDDDLVCGNGVGPNTLHRNLNGEFEQISTWFPEGYFGDVALALGDVDADGDLDLFSVGSGPGEGVSLYLNSGSGLDDLPSWEKAGRPPTSAVACGDLDADGDMDVLLGHDSGVAFHRNRTAPAAGFDPLVDHPRLPNEPAQLRSIRVVGDTLGTIGFGDIRHINFVAYDADADSIWIVAEYQEWGRSNWVRVASPGIVPPGPGIAKGPFAASARGTSNTIVWDLAGLSFGSYHLSLRLRTIAHPQYAGVIQVIPPHLTDVGTILSRQPLMEFDGLEDDTTLNFPAVTLGDTVLANLKILNAGNDTLRIHEMTPPFGDDLRFDVKGAFVVPPGGVRSVRGVFTPRQVWPPDGFVEIRSNDPVRPNSGFFVHAPSLDLTVRTQVLSTQIPVPLAQPLSIQVLPNDGVVIHNATLFHRWRDSLDDFTPVVMQRLPGETEPDGPFLTTLDASYIREIGLEYYVTVENDSIVRTDPPDAPRSVYHIDVQPPESFEVLPLQTGTSGFLSGRPISVIAEVPAGAVFDHGALYWRRGGAAQWHESPLMGFELNDTIATIPDSGVGERGVQYWVEMFTATTRMTNPIGAPDGLNEIQVRVPNLKEPDTQLAGRYRMVSFPLGFDTENLLVDQLLSDGEGFGPYDPIRWRVFRHDPAAANVEFTGTRPDLFEPIPGAAFWLVSLGTHRVDTAPVEGFSVPVSSSWTASLEKGWNQIGNPFSFPVAWSLVETSTPLDPPVAFDPALGAYGDYADEAVTVLRPFDGYFVYNPTSTQQWILVPPVEYTGASAKPAGTPLWSLRLVAASETATDASNRFGMDPGASDERDVFDALEPPPAPGEWVQLAFVQAGELRRRDVRATADGHAWDVEVRAAVRGTEVHVTATDLQQLPANWALRILDLEQDTSTDASGPSIFAFGPEQPYRLRVLAGTPAWVEQAATRDLALPVAFVADRVAPNPFRDATHFRFGIPRPTAVELHVYDVRGARVATLADGKSLPAGYHVRVWDGRDHSGRSAANGVYFARLRAGDRDAQWRLVLMR